MFGILKIFLFQRQHHYTESWSVFLRAKLTFKTQGGISFSKGRSSFLNSESISFMFPQYSWYCWRIFLWCQIFACKISRRERRRSSMWNVFDVFLSAPLQFCTSISRGQEMDSGGHFGSDQHHVARVSQSSLLLCVVCTHNLRTFSFKACNIL